MLTNLNGTLMPTLQAKLPASDSSTLFGDSLFETIRVLEGKAIWLEEHLDRLATSAARLEIPCDRDQLRHETHRLLERLDQGTFRLRITLSRGPMLGAMLPCHSNGNFAITASRYVLPSADEKEAGAVCLLAPNARVNPLSHLPQMKSGNYMDCLYARDLARRQGAFEAIFHDAHLGLLEGSTSNLFAVVKKTLITPPLGHLILNGIVRQKVMEIAPDHGLTLKEAPLTLGDCAKASELFLCNSLIGLYPVARIDEKKIKRGKQWMKLSKAVGLD